MKKIAAGTLIVVCFVLVFQSCVKDTFDFNKRAKTDWTPNIAVPLIYSSMTIKDILAKTTNDSVINVGSDNFVTLVYKSQFLSLKASDVFIIPNQQFNSPYTFGAAEVAGLNVTPIGSTYTANMSDTLDFDPGSAIVIDSLFLKTGSLNLDFSSDLKDNIQITFSIPKAKKNGVPFSQTITIIYSGSSPVTSSISPDLSGYIVDMTGSSLNRIVVNETISVTKSAFPALVGEQINLTETFTGITFRKIFGYVGQQSLASATKDTTAQFSVFSTSSGVGSFNLVDPKVKVHIFNSYGVPIKADFMQFDGYTPPSTIINVLPTVPYAIPINSPTVAQIGQLLQSSFTLNAQNSNIATVFNSKSQYAIYDISTQTNPGGNLGQNFILDTSSFKIDMDFELPLYGNASNFTLQDTLDFTFPTTENVQSLLLRTYIVNGFPIDLGVQIYFTDSLFNKIDSLVTPYQIIMPSASVNASTGKVSSPVSKTTDCNFNNTRITNLGKTRKLLIVAKASTFGSGNTPPANVKIYSDYKLDIRLGAQAQLKVKI